MIHPVRCWDPSPLLTYVYTPLATSKIRVMVSPMVHDLYCSDRWFVSLVQSQRTLSNPAILYQNCPYGMFAQY